MTVRDTCSLIALALSALYIGCAAHGSPAAPAPAQPVAAPRTDSFHVQMRIPGGDSTIAGVPDSLMRKLRAELAARDANTARAVRADVAPDTLRLTAGQRVAIREAVHITAYDSAGVVLDPFTPALSIEDRNVVTLNRGQIVAIQPGRTRLHVGAITERHADGRSTIRPLGTVLVVVTAQPGT